MTRLAVLPTSLDWLRSRSDGAAWLAQLPALLDRACRRWGLEITGALFEGGVAGLVLPVERYDQHCVLKLQWPHRECEHEAAALRAWNGNGAVQLLEHHADDHALLIERCTPGTFLAASDLHDPMAVMVDLLPRLWTRVDGPFRSLADEASGWRQNLPEAWSTAGRPCEASLIDATLAFIDELAGSQSEQVLVHQDLHGHNVLAADGGRWLAIDPKPLIGERAFSLAPVIRSSEFGEGEAHVVKRLDRLSSDLGIARDRAIGWTVAQTMAWSFDGKEHFPDHFETARWLLAAR